MKRVYFVGLSLILVALIMGCASSGGSSQSNVSNGRNPNYPDFYYDPPMVEDAMYGIGTAKTSSNSPSMALQMAESRARQDIAFQISASVKAMITDYAREAGNANSSANLQFAETVGQQLTQTTLRGTRTEKRWTAPDGTLWVLVSLNKADAARQASDAIENEASQYAEWKAMTGVDKMNEALKEQSKPTYKPE